MNIFGIDVGSVVKAYVIKEVFFKEKKPVDYTKHFDRDDYMMNMHIKEAIEYRNKGVFAKAWDLICQIFDLILTGVVCIFVLAVVVFLAFYLKYLLGY